MPRMQTNLGLPKDTRIKLDALVNTRPNGTTIVQVVGELIDAAHAQLKRIEPRRDGKKIIGWTAWYGDFCVSMVDGAGSKPQAQAALDAYVYEELSK